MTETKNANPQGANLEFYVVCANTKDYPGKIVVRRHVAIDGKLVADADPAIIAPNLEIARIAIKDRFGGHLMRMRPGPIDDPVIVEWYML